MPKKGDFFYTVRGDIRKRITERVNRDVAATRKEVVTAIIKDVEKDSVTRELASHTDPSSLFSSPQGSIFGLMGFRAGTNPVQQLLNYLRRESTFRTKYSKPFGVLDVHIQGPTDETMAAANLVTPWSDGRSWPEMLEKGIPGLSNFFAKEGYGKSKEGYQVERTFKGRPHTTDEIDYLSKIFKRANRRFRSILKRKLSS